MSFELGAKRFVVCEGAPRNEDAACSDSIEFPPPPWRIAGAVSDHLHYFGHKLPAYGKYGCAPNNEAAEEALPDSAAGPPPSLNAGEEQDEQNDFFHDVEERIDGFANAFFG